MLTAYALWVLALYWVCFGQVIPSMGNLATETNPAYTIRIVSTAEPRPLYGLVA